MVLFWCNNPIIKILVKHYYHNIDTRIITAFTEKLPDLCLLHGSLQIKDGSASCGQITTVKSDTVSISDNLNSDEGE